MPILNIPDTIRYQITTHDSGALFCLWEVPCPSDAPDQSFLFKVNQRVSSKAEAQQLLRHYIESFRGESLRAS